MGTGASNLEQSGIRPRLCIKKCRLQCCWCQEKESGRFDAVGFIAKVSNSKYQDSGGGALEMRGANLKKKIVNCAGTTVESQLCNCQGSLFRSESCLLLQHKLKYVHSIRGVTVTHFFIGLRLVICFDSSSMALSIMFFSYVFSQRLLLFFGLCFRVHHVAILYFPSVNVSIHLSFYVKP